MEKNNITEIVFIIDKSGSMCGLEADTIGGFNSMIAKQKEENAGEAFVTTILFDTAQKMVHDRLPLENVPEMTGKDYCPGGCTALLDALGDTIRHISKIHRYGRKEDVPAKTVFVITTDGMENSSRRYSSDEVRAMIRKEKEKYGWEFLFLGANIDAVETAARVGIGADRAVRYHNDRRGVALNYDTVNIAVGRMRACAPVSANWKEAIEADYAGREANSDI